MSKLLAPNGKPSNLTPEQYALVRTPQFKTWFGDWENDPKNASQVIDENGEPLVVYRGWSSNSKFGNTFSYKRNLFRDTSAISKRKSNRFGFYFTENKKIAENYAEDFSQAYNEQIEGSAKEIARPIVQGYFLNARNICDISPTNKKFQNLRSRISGVRKVYKGNYDLKEMTEWEVNRYTTTLGMKSLSEIVGFNRQDIENELYADDLYLRRYDSNYANDIFANMIHNDYHDNIDEFLKTKLIENNFDGVKFQEDTHYYTSLSRKEKALFDQNEKKGIIQNYPLVYAIFEPNQIKLADGTNTTFDENNPDIRYSKGGNTQQSLEVKLVEDKDLSDELLDIAYVELGYVGQPRLALLENGKIIGGIFLEKPSSYIENGEYVVQPMWEYKFDIVIVKSKRNKGYSKILLDAMIEDFVSNFPDADQIRAEVTNKKLEKSLQKKYGFSCDSRNDEKITYCYLSKEAAEKYKNTADIKFENGGTTKKNMKKVDKGGITYGRSHAEGGIPVKNESTGEMLEVEGGEGIINKKAMASPQMVKIDGKEMTICEAASYLNQKDGNGRQFNCDDVEHQQFLTDHYGVGGELKKGIKKMNEGKMAKGGKAENVKFDIETEEERTVISIKGIGQVVLTETFPNYEFLEDINEDKLKELGIEEDDVIGKIEHIQVEDKFRGQGYAKLLMKKAIEVAKRKGLMPLYLNASPMGSRGLNTNDLTSFYENFGFEVFLEQGHNNLMILKSQTEKNMAKGGMFDGQRLNKTQETLYNTIKNSASKSMYTYNLSFEVERALNDLYLMGLVNREYIKGTQDAKYTLKQEYATGGTVMNNSQDAENAIFDAAVFEHGGTVNAYDAGLHKKMYMLGIEVMQPDPIALARVMSKENDNFCEHYPKLCAGAEYQREELPQIYDKNYDEFVAYLENLGATVNFEGDTAVDSLKPVQNEISLERMARIMARVKDGYYKDLNLLKLPLFVSKDGYILDGHHRWATLFFLSPTNTLDIYRVNLTYKELVDKALNFDDAGTEKFMLGGMVNKQEQLDDASKITLRFSKGKVDCYYNFQNMQYSDLVRIEGSSQALLQGKFNPILWGYTSTGQFLNSHIYQQNIQAIRELQKTGGYDDWKIISEYSAIQEKRSIAVDFYINKQKTSHGILELFDTSLPNYNMFIGELYCETVVQYIKEIMNLLSLDDWRKRGQGSLQSTAEYQLASYFYQINISKIYKIAQDSKNAEEAGQSYDVFNADTNFITIKEAEQLMNRMFSSPSPKQPNNKNQNLTKSPQQAQQIIQQLQQGTLQTTKFGVISKGEAYEFDNIDAVQQFVNDFIFEDDMLVTYGGKMVNIPKESPAAEVKTILTDLYGWNWRFKTEQEFIDEYGVAWYVDANADVDWNRERQEYDMDFLFGQPIAENPTSENAIDNLIEENDNYRVVNVTEYFGIKNPNPNGKVEYGIVKEFITDKPLPNAVTPTTQTTTKPITKPLIKPLYYGLESSFNAFYPTIGRVKPENRFSYMNWEDVVKYYELAKKESDEATDAFIYAVCVVYNTSRMSGELTYSLVRNMLEKDSPSDAMKELFSNNYYFSPMYFDFYTSLYDKIEKSILNAGWTRPTVTNQKLQSLINIGDTAANLGGISTGYRGFAGLGNFRDTNSSKLYPNLITTEYESDQKNAYASNSRNLQNNVIVSYIENLSFNNDNWSDTILQKSAVPLIKTLSGSYYQYEDLSEVPTAMIYSPNSQSKLFDYMLYKGGVGEQNDFMFWDFARPLLPQNFFIDADFIRLISNFKTDGYLDSKELDSLIDVGERLQIRSDLSNGSFLVKIQDIQFSLQFDVITRMDAWNSLSDDQKVLFLKFMTLYNSIVESARKEIAKIFEETTTGVMQRSGVGSMPTSTQPAPTWNWRFKTEQEFNKEYGNTWKKLLGWDLKGKMDYLFGQPLQEKPQGKIVINNFINNIFTASTVNTEGAFGLVSPTGENMWDFKVQMFTQQPLPISAQPSPKTAKPTQRTATQKVEKEVYYSELMYDGVLGKNDKIVGARFLTEKEIKNYENKYGTSLLGLAVNTLRLDWNGLNLNDAQQSYDDGGLEWTKDLLGQPLNPNLLPAVIEIFKFQKTINPTKAKEIFRTTYDSPLTDELRVSRLVIGQSNIGEYDFWKPIFPNVSEFDYLNANTFSETMSKFPDWYKNIADERLKSMSVWNSKPLDPKSYSIGNDLFYPYYFFTGQINTKNKGEKDRQVPYASIPFTYLILEIETEEQVLINITTNQSEIKKIKEEYAALQYYLNVEVPIDAFAQRKLITTVMEGVSDKLEKEIEALFYSPSFEPLFDFWAEKQTQGQRTIDLQPCMLATPNGQKSELDLIQYEIVRSEEFKKWFGDWEEAAVTGNYNGVSRAINPLTKEPQVAFHGKANMALEFTKMAFATFPVKYFGTNLSYAEWFKENQSKSDRLTKLVYEFFLDIKNPIDLSPIGLTELTAEEFKELIKAQYNYDIQSRLHDEGTGKKNKLWVLIRFSPQMLEELKANTYFDGFIMYEDNSQDLTASGYDTNLLGFSPNSYELVQQVAGTPIGNFTLDFVTFTNFQIKAADGRNTTFFNNVEDFRFAKGGITKKRKK